MERMMKTIEQIRAALADAHPSLARGTLNGRVEMPTTERDAMLDIWAQVEFEELAAREAAKLGAIKSAAGAVILARLPAWRQANLTARALELSDAKHTRELTESELGEQSAIASAWAWVRVVRAHSDAIEALAASGETVDLAAVEWPAP
jgi:hypothetical protein